MLLSLTSLRIRPGWRENNRFSRTVNTGNQQSFNISIRLTYPIRFSFLWQSRVNRTSHLPIDEKSRCYQIFSVHYLISQLMAGLWYPTHFFFLFVLGVHSSMQRFRLPMNRTFYSHIALRCYKTFRFFLVFWVLTIAHRFEPVL